MTQRSVVPFRSSQSGLSPQSSQLSPRIQGSLDHYGDAAFAVEEITQTTIDSHGPHADLRRVPSRSA